MLTKLIAGLGNPGRKYERSRHNVGFMVVDTLAETLHAEPWRSERQASVARVQYGGNLVWLAKPQTFMNLSGVAVRALLTYYRLEPAELLVICDDLDLPFGRLRLRPGGSPGGHNGLRSIIAELGTQDFPRLRVGIGRPDHGEPIDWVLAPFDGQHEADLAFIRHAAASVVESVLRDGLLAAMNACNGRRDVRTPEPVAAPSEPRQIEVNTTGVGKIGG